jgi:hypothetical protein
MPLDLGQLLRWFRCIWQAMNEATKVYLELYIVLSIKFYCYYKVIFSV